MRKGIRVWLVLVLLSGLAGASDDGGVGPKRAAPVITLLPPVR